MDDKLQLGKIVNTHALKGEVKVTPWCDDADIFSSLDSIDVGGAELEIEAAKPHKNSVLIKFKGIDSVEAAERLRGKVLCADKALMGPLPDNTYYIADLIGLEVYTGERRLGVLDDCFPTGSNDVYVVRGEDGKQLLLPAIKQVIKRVDIAARRMETELLEGMEDEN